MQVAWLEVVNIGRSTKLVISQIQRGEWVIRNIVQVTEVSIWILIDWIYTTNRDLEDYDINLEDRYIILRDYNKGTFYHLWVDADWVSQTTGVD